MRTGNGNIVLLRYLYGTCCHDVRNGGSKQNNQICLSNLRTEISRQLCEHLAFAVEFLADVLERMMRDAKITEIYEGTSEV